MADPSAKEIARPRPARWGFFKGLLTGAAIEVPAIAVGVWVLARLGLGDPEVPFMRIVRLTAIFAGIADEAIAGIRARGRRVIVCGGTFLWVKALVQGLAPLAPSSDAIRARHKALAEAEGRARLHAMLAEIDPASAARLAPNDLVRVSRALEVHELTGVPLSRWQAEHGFRSPRYEARLVGVRREREELDRRIEARVRAMLAAGWIDEVRALKDRQGTTLVDALSENGVVLDRMLDAHGELKQIDARAYLELHIEQGPVLESMQKATGVVLGTFGVERHMIRFTGQAAHSGSTPIAMRRDAFLAAAQMALECRDIALRHSKPTPGDGGVQRRRDHRSSADDPRRGESRQLLHHLRLLRRPNRANGVVLAGLPDHPHLVRVAVRAVQLRRWPLLQLRRPAAVRHL